jgi:hypothetical protein
VQPYWLRGLDGRFHLIFGEITEPKSFERVLYFTMVFERGSFLYADLQLPATLPEFPPVEAPCVGRRRLLQRCFVRSSGFFGIGRFKTARREIIKA